MTDALQLLGGAASFVVLSALFLTVLLPVFIFDAHAEERLLRALLTEVDRKLRGRAEHLAPHYAAKLESLHQDLQRLVSERDEDLLRRMTGSLLRGLGTTHQRGRARLTAPMVIAVSEYARAHAAERISSACRPLSPVDAIDRSRILILRNRIRLWGIGIQRVGLTAMREALRLLGTTVGELTALGLLIAYVLWFFQGAVVATDSLQLVEALAWGATIGAFAGLVVAALIVLDTMARRPLQAALSSHDFSRRDKLYGAICILFAVVMPVLLVTGQVERLQQWQIRMLAPIGDWEPTEGALLAVGAPFLAFVLYLMIIVPLQLAWKGRGALIATWRPLPRGAARSDQMQRAFKEVIAPGCFAAAFALLIGGGAIMAISQAAALQMAEPIAAAIGLVATFGFMVGLGTPLAYFLAYLSVAVSEQVRHRDWITPPPLLVVAYSILWLVGTAPISVLGAFSMLAGASDVWLEVGLLVLTATCAASATLHIRRNRRRISRSRLQPANRAPESG